MSSCNGLYRPSRSASLPLSLPFFFPGYSASVPSAFASVSALSRSAPFPSAHPFGLASVSQLSTFRFLAAAFFFHSFELLFSAFRLSLFQASSRLRFLPFRAFPRSFGLLLAYSYLLDFFLFRAFHPPAFFSVLSNFFSGLPSLFPFGLTYGLGFSALRFPFSFRSASQLRFRFSAFCFSASCRGFLLFRVSAFRLPFFRTSFTAPVSSLSGLPPVFWASLPSLPASFSFELSACLLFCSFELLFRPAVSLRFRAYLRFRFFGFGIPFVLPLPLSVLLPFSQLSAFASCCGFLFPLFRASFFCLPSLFPFGLPYGSGFFPFGLSCRSFGLCPPYSLFPSALPFGFASVFGFPLSLPARAFFSFELSALPSFLLFRTSFPACRLSALSSFLTV